ncbi:MAG: zinc ribbon domain-containing protein [Deltaproteobacteria bacterium]|nr:zinc ribbon domain-containing protein [Deltaproteobacteria bacterium]MBW1795058.1 zinc ribbon domain-containing protein [Deltaproteobacteria bacterium]MBW2330168.1 zinc ribbon domain-containing protein [Deltaproteobacteria bacterium]
MPLYEFRCPKCGHEFEQIVFSSDKGLVKCPKCAAPKPERLLSIFSSSTTGMRAGASVSSSCAPSSRGFS